MVETEFESRFGNPSSCVAAAPGRVNLIGEHIDYNDGFVLPMAIDRYVVIAAAPIAADPSADSSQSSATIYSTDMRESVEVPLKKGSQPTLSNWGRYLEGVVAGFVERGIDVPPFSAVLASNVPNGGGLSSSAALEVATATMLESLTGTRLTSADKALLCQRAEHEYAGVPCGIMDQFSSVFGKPNELMLLDCQTQEIRPVAFDASDITVLITNSNVKHELTGGEYAARRADCDRALEKLGNSSWRNVTMQDVESAGDRLSDVELRRAKHVVSEIGRTTEAADAFRASDWKTVGQLMYASHDSLRDDFEVSCQELDWLVEIAGELGTAGGVIGSRMTGGGFGGCTVTLVENDKLESVVQAITSKYESISGTKASCFSSRPALGAHLIRGKQ